MLNTEPRAVAARYDRASGQVVIDLMNGCTYAFPAKLVQDVQGASDDDLAGVEVDGMGFKLHWPALNVDLLTPALVSGLFGTRTWMTRELARIAGKATSPPRPPQHAPTAPRAGDQERRRLRSGKNPAELKRRSAYLTSFTALVKGQ